MCQAFDTLGAGGSGVNLVYLKLSQDETETGNNRKFLL